MSSLRRVTACAPVAAFLSIGKDACDADNNNSSGNGDGTTLQLRRWRAILDALEHARAQLSTAPSSSSALSPEACAAALQHYHDVYTSCAAHTVLPPQRWRMWQCGLRELFMSQQMTTTKTTTTTTTTTVTTTATTSTSTTMSDVTYTAIAQLRVRLLRDYDAQFAIAFWGTAASVHVRLARMLHDEGDDDKKKKNEAAAEHAHDSMRRRCRGGDAMTRCMRRRAALLHGFAVLCADARHLYDSYGALGCAERVLLVSSRDNTNNNNNSNSNSNNGNNESDKDEAQRQQGDDDDDDNTRSSHDDDNADECKSEDDDDDDNAVDVLLARTLARDVCVPSAWLCNDAAVEDEVNSYAADDGDDDDMPLSSPRRRGGGGSKLNGAAALLQRRACTLRSRWAVAAAALAEYEAAPSARVRTRDDAATGDKDGDDVTSTASSVLLSSLLTYDERGDALADAVAAALAEAATQQQQQQQQHMPSHAVLYSALAFFMHRVLSREAFVCTMNGARVDYALSLLQRWLATYVARTHRGRLADDDSDVFVQRDTDDDVWTFVLQRHEVLLRLALAYAQQQQDEQDEQQQQRHRDMSAATRAKGTDNEDDSNDDKSTRKDEARLRAQLHVLRSVAYSLLHCWQVYVATALALPVNADKRRRRIAHVTTCTHAWLLRRLVRHYARALLHDVYDTFDNKDSDDENDEESSSEATAAQDTTTTTTATAAAAAALTLECEVKLVVSDVLAFVCRCAHDDDNGNGDGDSDSAMTAARRASEVRRQTRERLLPLLEPLVHAIAAHGRDDEDKTALRTEITTATAAAVSTSRRLTLLQLLLRVLSQLERTHTDAHHTHDTHEEQQQLLCALLDAYRHAMHCATALAATAETETVTQSCAFLLELASDGWLRCLQWCSSNKNNKCSSRGAVVQAGDDMRRGTRSTDIGVSTVYKASCSSSGSRASSVLTTAARYDKYNNNNGGGRRPRGGAATPVAQQYTLVDLQYEQRKAFKQLTRLRVRADGSDTTSITAAQHSNKMTTNDRDDDDDDATRTATMRGDAVAQTARKRVRA